MITTNLNKLSIKDLNKLSIKDLRKLGGEWKAVKKNFGVYCYEGLWLKSEWLIESYAHMAHLYDGDDENFVVKWHIFRDGKQVGHPTATSPVFFLEGVRNAEAARTKKQNNKRKA